MKKFVIKVLLFFACVVVMDLAFGYMFSWLRSHAKGGSTANCEYIANRANEDIIILGSSRATHHYIPKIIEDSLGVTCYNCGEDGNGIVLAYGRYKQIVSRKKPKLIVYEITPVYDYVSFEPNSKYLGYLRPYYDKQGVKQLFDDFDDELSCLKMKSKMYQNMSRLMPNLFDNFFYRDNNRGYSPLNGKLKSFPEMVANDCDKIDNKKMDYLKKIIMESKNNNIPICFVVSPKCVERDGYYQEYEPISTLCEKFDVPFYNFIFVDGISNKPELFQDAGHLNGDGSRKYTSIFLKEIRDNI